MCESDLTMAVAPRKVTLVADELLGYTRTGGIGTATSFLALALGRMGHRVAVLYIGEPPGAAMSPEWAASYEQASVGIRLLHRADRNVEPAYFARMLDVEHALAADPPDVVVVQDLAAPAYTALRMRQLGFGFEQTLFVAYCHGTRRWITDMAQKVRVLPGAHAVTILEQASIELADVAVSPSRYLIDWMRDERWRLPSRSLVIPYLTRAVATGEEPPPRAGAATNGVERIAFFGRLEERKGLRPFASALNRLEPELLRGRELEFVGAPTAAWPPRRVESLLSADVRGALRGISFATDLDQPEALARLSRPGTLAVMPSLGESFSNAVYECLERRIPFIASDAGAPRELVAAEDRPRVLFEPTAEGVAAALRRALQSSDAARPASPAFDAHAPYDAWADVVRMTPQQDAPREPTSAADFAVVLAEHDQPDPQLEETLRRAQAASAADVVTCGLRLGTAERLFLGDPGGLGLIENHYGAAALVRRSLLPAEREEIWPLLARLATGGARIVSVPRALVERRDTEARDSAREALAVAQRFEERLPPALRSLARLTTGLAAASKAAPDPSRRSRLRRVVDRIVPR
jgi:glycosyltransferase involved in cell wall biosynthesis